MLVFHPSQAYMPATYNIPLDSPLGHILPHVGGPEHMLNGANTARYVNLAALVLLFWDHIITFDKEVERIWTLPWRLPKALFMLTRYILPPAFVFGWSVFTKFQESVSVCNFVWAWKMWPSRITIVSVQLVIILRVLALYNVSSKIMPRLIILAYICEVGGIVALNIINILNTNAISTFGLVPGCIFHLVPHSLSNNWIPPILFEGLIVILTLSKLYPYSRSSINPTLRVLGRDSIVYFMFMIAIHTVNLVIWRTDAFIFGDAYATPSSVMACIAVSHMMMNLRGLSPDIKNTSDLVDSHELRVRHMPATDSTLSSGFEKETLNSQSLVQPSLVYEV